MAEIICQDYGINWIWYAHVVLNEDGTATVTREYRVHKGDDGHPKATADYRIEEAKVAFTEPRVATGIRVNNVLYPFAAPIPRWDVGKR